MKNLKLFAAAAAVALSVAGCSTTTDYSSDNTRQEEAEAQETREEETLKGIEFGRDIAVVKTDKGSLRGYIDHGIFTYKGIPYATAERFEEPKEVEPWDYIRDAQVYGVMAPQSDMTTGQSEVLTIHNFVPEATNETENQIQSLNIWTPELNPGAKKPVLFWIHGGGFSTGAGSEQVAYDGRNLAEYGDVVVVSINHRLNALGYIDLSSFGEKYKDAVNLGQKDIVAALKWVNKNIAAFGGDPGNVMIFGQSGGGGKVMSLLAAPSAEGLFAKAAVMSGENGTLTKEQGQRIGERTAELLGLTQETIDEIRTVDYDELLAANEQAFLDVSEETGEYLDYHPEVDGEFITGSWLDGTIGDLNKDVPVMIGSVFSEVFSNASLTFDDGNGATFINELTDQEVQDRIAARFGDDTEDMMDAFREVYPNNKDVDILYFGGTLLSGNPEAAAMAERGASTVYKYIFDFEIPTMGGWLAWHCSELPYVFHNIDKTEITNGHSQEVLEMEEMMSDLWLNFARTGVPSHEGMIEWPAYTAEERNVMIIDTEPYITDQTKIDHLLELYTANGGF